MDFRGVISLVYCSLALCLLLSIVCVTMSWGLCSILPGSSVEAEVRGGSRLVQLKQVCLLQWQNVGLLPSVT